MPGERKTVSIDTLKAQVAILVSSCDKYQDIWPIFFTLFWRYWPDCPFSIYLLTNHARYDDARVKSIPVGDDRQWASNCRVALRQIPYPYIFLMEEENLYRRAVNTRYVCELISFGMNYGAGCFRLYPSPGPDRPLAGRNDVGIIDPGAPYRVAFSAAVWRRDVLESLLVDGETGWDMELKGSRRSDRLEVPFLSVTFDPTTGRNTNPPLPYMSRVVVRGRWTQEAVALCRKEGLTIDRANRRVRLPWEDWWESSWPRRTISATRRIAGKCLRRLGVLKRRDGLSR
jgi:hypothetical protein